MRQQEADVCPKHAQTLRRFEDHTADNNPLTWPSYFFLPLFFKILCEEAKEGVLIAFTFFIS